MNGKCEFTIGRRYPKDWETRGCQPLPCDAPASWRYTRAADDRTVEFCEKHAVRLGALNPTDLGSWERLASTDVRPTTPNDSDRESGENGHNPQPTTNSAPETEGAVG